MAKILLKRSSDSGFSWTKTAHVAAWAGGQSGNPAPTLLADNSTLILVFQHVTNDHHPSYAAFATRSTDDGLSFSSPVNISAQTAGRYGSAERWETLPSTNWWDVGPPGGVIDAQGRAVQCMNEEDPPVRDGGKPWVFSSSSADGITWLPGHRQPLSGDGSGECQIARAGMGGRRLIIFARSQPPGTPPMGSDPNGTLEHAVLTSDDGGAHWSAPTRVTSVPGPNCEGSIIGIPPADPSGQWSLVAAAPSNTIIHDDKGGLLRAGLRMYTSQTGTDWAPLSTIDVNASAYSSLLKMPGEPTVLVMYEAGTGTSHDAPYGGLHLARRAIPGPVIPVKTDDGAHLLRLTDSRVASQTAVAGTGLTHGGLFGKSSAWVSSLASF